MSGRYAIIENNTIVNVINADEQFISEHYPEAILCADNVGVGDGYIDGQFISNSLAEVIETNGETL